MRTLQFIHLNHCDSAVFFSLQYVTRSGDHSQILSSADFCFAPFWQLGIIFFGRWIHVMKFEIYLLIYFPVWLYICVSIFGIDLFWIEWIGRDRALYSLLTGVCDLVAIHLLRRRCGDPNSLVSTYTGGVSLSFETNFCWVKILNSSWSLLYCF